MKKYLLIFLISMVPLVELRGAIPIALGMGLPAIPSILVCVLGNVLPVPFIYFFARKFLVWGKNKPLIGKICTFFVVKGERAGQKLAAKAGRGGLALALMLFVGIPLPGTGAWTGALIATLLGIKFKKAFPAILLGILIATIIMALISYGLLGSLIGVFS